MGSHTHGYDEEPPYLIVKDLSKGITIEDLLNVPKNKKNIKKEKFYNKINVDIIDMIECIWDNNIKI